MKNLTDKTAVVTGAGSGIGSAVAIELARQGAHVAICCDSNMAGLEQTAEKITELGRRVTTHQVDVADRAKVETFAEEVVAAHPRIDILVNNAGVGLVAPVAEMTIDDFEWLMQINFWGLVYGTKAFLPHLIDHESHIVNISSVWGLWAAPSQSAYTCSKFAIRGFSEALGQELASTPVAVSLVFPGGVRTEIVRKSRFRAAVGPIGQKRAQWLMENLAPTSSERAAKIIVKAIRRKQRRVLIGPEAYVLDVAQRLFPSLYQRLMPRLLAIGSATSRQP